MHIRNCMHNRAAHFMVGNTPQLGWHLGPALHAGSTLGLHLLAAKTMVGHLSAGDWPGDRTDPSPAARRVW